jgi:hypothetical protein
MRLLPAGAYAADPRETKRLGHLAMKSGVELAGALEVTAVELFCSLVKLARLNQRARRPSSG